MNVSTSDSVPPDLEAYLARIGYDGALTPSAAVLEALHLGHATRIPFENLDVLLRRPIRLELEAIQAKLVAGGRGGYCFEHNLLFAAVLRAAGFPVRQLAARVRYRTERVLPRTHMLLLVHADGSDLIADVGFGGEGLLLPIPLTVGAESRQFAWTYRIVEDTGQWLLQSLRQDVWQDLYAFTREPQLLADYEMANHYTSTHPDSRFVRTLAVQLPGTKVRRVLRNRELIEDRGRDVTSRMLADDDELLDVLARIFGLHVPAGTRFPFQDSLL
jgi:N-hydroxyarylamine O-acetyltransferase